MRYLTEDSPAIKSGNEKKKFKRWSKEIRTDDVTKRIEVEEVTNGYIITVSKYGTGEDGKYFDDCTKKISTTNPFEKSEDKEEDGFDGLMSSAVKTMDDYL